MAGHWSKDLATLWWRDKGTQRMRVSFHADPQKLKAKFERLWHPEMDAALYHADGSRIPLVYTGGTPKKKRKVKKGVRASERETVAATE